MQPKGYYYGQDYNYSLKYTYLPEIFKEQVLVMITNNRNTTTGDFVNKLLKLKQIEEFTIILN